MLEMSGLFARCDGVKLQEILHFLLNELPSECHRKIFRHSSMQCSRKKCIKWMIYSALMGHKNAKVQCSDMDMEFFCIIWRGMAVIRPEVIRFRVSRYRVARAIEGFDTEVIPSGSETRSEMQITTKALSRSWQLAENPQHLMLEDSNLIIHHQIAIICLRYHDTEQNLASKSSRSSINKIFLRSHIREGAQRIVIASPRWYSSYFPPFALNHHRMSEAAPGFSILSSTTATIRLTDLCSILARGEAFYGNAIVVDDHQFFPLEAGKTLKNSSLFNSSERDINQKIDTDNLR